MAVDKNFVKNKLGTIAEGKMNEIWVILDKLTGRS